MTGVPFFGGEAGAFTPSDANAIETTSNTFGDYDSAFARCALSVQNNTSYWTSATIQNLTDAWCAFQIRVGGQTYNVTQTIWRWHNAAGTTRFSMTYNRQTFQLALYYWNGTALTLAGSAITLDAN